MKTHILGFPRIGADRELKKALELFWRGESSESELRSVARHIRLAGWQTQKEAGLSMTAVGDFSLYDSMLDTALMLGAVPYRFSSEEPTSLTTYFAMARGDAGRNIPAMEMTKWFNTNYHYIVPEIEEHWKPTLCDQKVLDETDEALAAGFDPKPVLIGPITWLSLAKAIGSFNPWSKLPEILNVYGEVLSRLAGRVEWIQLDEPILAGTLPAAGIKMFHDAMDTLNRAAGSSKILLTTYFDAVDDHLDLALESGCAGLHLDLVRGGQNLANILDRFPSDKTLSAGVVEGRNIWRNDYATSLETLQRLRERLGDRLMIASSCSLLHVPVDLENEKALDPELKSWMAFARQKCVEVRELADLASGQADPAVLEANRRAITSRRESCRVHRADVTQRLHAADDSMLHRKSPRSTRKIAQKRLGLPLLPTTTIGSFPQTDAIRRTRREYKKGLLSREEYEKFLRQTIAETVRIQEELGLDVLVHGEPERNDMVEYFGERLDGFCFTENGWVQSYGSRCVKPPVIFGDVARPHPMTVEWIRFAQSLTQKPMKGMLTGPVTILCWSFVRDDLPRREVCRQIALAIRDEVADLESAGIGVIQIDEAALSEGMPIKERDRDDYLHWAVEAFRLATSCADDTTQIHSHMCYSQFNTILYAIAEMDADVISIEASRSKMELLDGFKKFNYPNDIGPGVYDIHSPRIPSKKEIVELLQRALAVLSVERLWVNPDCGLKTRSWDEARPSLTNMVAAAKEVRASLE